MKNEDRKEKGKKKRSQRLRKGRDREGRVEGRGGQCRKDRKEG